MAAQPPANPLQLQLRPALPVPGLAYYTPLYNYHLFADVDANRFTPAEGAAIVAHWRRVNTLIVVPAGQVYAGYMVCLLQPAGERGYCQGTVPALLQPKWLKDKGSGQKKTTVHTLVWRAQNDWAQIPLGMEVSHLAADTRVMALGCETHALNEARKSCNYTLSAVNICPHNWGHQCVFQ